jgi:hypothetical protein
MVSILIEHHPCTNRSSEHYNIGEEFSVGRRHTGEAKLWTKIYVRADNRLGLAELQQSLRSTSLPQVRDSEMRTVYWLVGRKISRVSM